VTYDRFFEQATGRSPYPFQRALAMADELPEALIAPTGAGKTAAAILAWLYRRRFAADAVRQATPRRLVFCLPMRTLVSQAAESARTWLSKLELLDEGRGLKRAHGVPVATLLGGEVDDDWYLHPERDAVIVGTQDMLLSRALNRGYASSRFHWPWDFALLSNDCLWIFDEVQLMGVGLTTALQLAGLRSALGAYGSGGSLFMSATLDAAWLTTIDHPEAGGVLPLSSADLSHPDLSRRRTAPKRLSRMEAPLGRDWARRVGRLVRDRHIAGTRTLVVVNSVDRAVDLFAEVQKGAKTESVLLHSRFRPPDRERALRQALAHGFDGIVVSTQVIEAGVDISSRTLFTELAPWTSLVQRAGRCNRAGEFAEADVVWLDSEVDSKSALPYSPEALGGARAHLEGLTSFNPEAIENAAVHMQPPDVTQVLRRRDLEDLFDTTPDLAGYDIDVSRFIRDGEERDVQVFWRATPGAPSSQEPGAQRDELCAVPFLRFREWLMKHRGRAWRWDHLEGAWDEAQPDRVVPGAVFLVDAQAGGYQPTIGWAADSDQAVASLLPARPDERAEPEAALDDDRLSELSRWVTLRQHSLDTRDAAREIVGMLSFPDLPGDVIVRAAHAHDLGKAHQVFQDTMRRTGGSSDNLWAKSGGRFVGRHSRRGFRHELASALVWLALGPEADRDLIAYLLAAHHGKVRASIRALPTDSAPSAGPPRPHARGIWEGDEFPIDGLVDLDLGEGLILGRARLALAPAILGSTDGQASWVSRVLALRRRFGPFRLAMLEALVRAADVRASMREAGAGE
jgi:CRISPR-associated endonuclease/helicase Cas3